MRLRSARKTRRSTVDAITTAMKKMVIHASGPPPNSCKPCVLRRHATRSGSLSIRSGGAPRKATE